MALRDGDVIEFDYELWVDGREGLYDTTLRAAAEQAGRLEPNAFYIPLTYVVGSGRIVPGLERALRDATVGRPTDVALDAADGYGERDPAKIETVPMSEFRKHDVVPEAGLSVVYKNRRGTVVTVGGGRVRLDFNPPLAGRRLRYRFTLRGAARDDAEKAAGILRMHFPTADPWTVQLEKGAPPLTALVEVPEAVSSHRDWLVAKYRALVDLRRFTAFERVRFLETFRIAPSAAAADPATQATPSPGSAGV